jgi:dihydroorotate dehydrogenase
VLDGRGAQAKLKAGASLVQLYSGLIYRGPGLVRECVQATANHVDDRASRAPDTVRAA